MKKNSSLTNIEIPSVVGDLSARSKPDRKETSLTRIKSHPRQISLGRRAIVRGGSGAPMRSSKASFLAKVPPNVRSIFDFERDRRIWLEKMQRGEYDEINQGVIAGIFGNYDESPPRLDQSRRDEPEPVEQLSPPRQMRVPK